MVQGSIYNDSTGNIGIGTNSPANKLTLYDGELTLQTDDNTQDQGILFQNNGEKYTWRIYRSDAGENKANLKFSSGLKNDFTALDDIMIIQNDGNVAIGTDTANAMLHVAGDFRLENGTKVNEISTDQTLGDNSNNAIPTEKAVKKYVDNQIIGVEEDDPQVGVNEAGYVSKWDGTALVQGSIYNDSTGNTGIGTTTPQKALSVIGKIRSANDTTEENYVQIGHNGTDGQVKISGAGRLDFKHGSETIMSFLENGNIGIGTKNPDSLALLDIEGTIKIQGGGPGEGKVLMSDTEGLARWEQLDSLYGMWNRGFDSVTLNTFINYQGEVRVGDAENPVVMQDGILSFKSGLYLDNNGLSFENDMVSLTDAGLHLNNQITLGSNGLALGSTDTVKVGNDIMINKNGLQAGEYIYGESGIQNGDLTITETAIQIAGEVQDNDIAIDKNGFKTGEFTYGPNGLSLNGNPIIDQNGMYKGEIKVDGDGFSFGDGLKMLLNGLKAGDFLFGKLGVTFEVEIDGEIVENILIDENGNFAIEGGEGINVEDNIITNTQPDKIVTLTSENNGLSISGTYPNFDVTVNKDEPRWNAKKLMDHPIGGQDPELNEVLKWNGSKWKPAQENWILDENDSSVSTAYRVGIGTDEEHPIDSAFKLSVNGEIRAIAITVESDWADYVFEDDYELTPLDEVAEHIKSHKRLPDMPSAETVQQEGLDLGEMQTRMMAKIEELTLYLIEMKQENEALKTKIENLENQVNDR